MMTNQTQPILNSVWHYATLFQRVIIKTNNGLPLALEKEQTKQKNRYLKYKQNANGLFCKNCNEPLYLKQKVFCSVECSKNTSLKAARKPLSKRTCPQCGIVFTPKTSNKQVFCGKSCSATHSNANKGKKP